MEPLERRVSGPGGELAVWEHAGDGPPALLLHGFAHAGRQWDFFAGAVRGRLRLIAPDARGHGDSARPPAGYAQADFVADIAAILDALDLERVAVVGHSMGGAHGAAFTLAHPERVSTLVVIDTGPSLAPAGRERSRRLTATRPERFATIADIEAHLRRTSPGYADEVHAHRARWLFRPSADGFVWRSDAAALERILRASGATGEPWDRLGDIAAPTLVVRGTHGYLARDTALGMIERLPDGRLLELDAGHNVHLDRPGELADAVVAFAGPAAPMSPGAVA